MDPVPDTVPEVTAMPAPERAAPARPDPFVALAESLTAMPELAPPAPNVGVPPPPSTVGVAPPPGFDLVATAPSGSNGVVNGVAPPMGTGLVEPSTGGPPTPPPGWMPQTSPTGVIGTIPSAQQTPVPPVQLTRAELRAARARSVPPKRKVKWRRRTLLVAAVVALAALTAGARLGEPAAAATMTLGALPVVTTPGATPAFTWAATGESAVAVPALGVAAQSGPETPVPVASLTKLITALVILRDHPLAVGADGPMVTIGSADIEDYEQDIGSDQANVQVASGEALSERQLLEGLVVHSANNFADTLARWDAGSIPAFVVKMNAAAKSLGMSHSSFADADGYDPQSVSTAGDLLRVAAALMADPSFAGIAAMTSVTLPVAGVQASYTPLLGTRGVVGVKSGFTTAAGGCDVLALSSEVDGHPVTVLAAVTGQQGQNVLAEAGSAAFTLATSALAGVHAVDVVTAGERLGSVHSYGHLVHVVAQRTVSVLSWAGKAVRTSVVSGTVPRAGASAGTVVARTVVRAGGQRLESPIGLARDLPAPTLVQRLF